nr:tetratricopeptide repeat protein [Streptomyces tardus]
MNAVLWLLAVPSLGFGLLYSRLPDWFDGDSLAPTLTTSVLATGVALVGALVTYATWRHTTVLGRDPDPGPVLLGPLHGPARPVRLRTDRTARAARNDRALAFRLVGRYRLALAALPPFSGFFSKEAVLGAAEHAAVEGGTVGTKPDGSGGTGGTVGTKPDGSGGTGSAEPDRSTGITSPHGGTRSTGPDGATGSEGGTSPIGRTALDGGHSIRDALVSRTNLARALHDTGDVLRAASLLATSVAEAEQLLGPLHPITRDIGAALVDNRLLRGELTGAREQLKRDLAEMGAAFATRHPEVRVAHVQLAEVLSGLGEHGEACALLTEILRSWEETVGTGEPATLSARADLVRAHLAADEAARALTLQEENVRLAREHLGRDHPATRDHQALRNQLYGRTGDWPRAVAAHEELASDLEDAPGSADVGALLAAVRHQLALAYLESGDAERAVVLAEHTLSLLEQYGGRLRTDSLYARSVLARAYAATGDTERGAAMLRHALADAELHHGQDAVTSARLRTTARTWEASRPPTGRPGPA